MRNETGTLLSPGAKYIDSQQQELEPHDIVMIAGGNQPEYAHLKAEQLWAAVSSEIYQGESLAIRNGNTLFICKQTPENVVVFRALNADTPQNYLENCKMFIKAAQLAGFKALTTNYQDKQIARLLQVVKDTGAEYFDPNTRLETIRLEDGSYQSTIFVLGSIEHGDLSQSQDPDINTPPKGMFQGRGGLGGLQ